MESVAFVCLTPSAEDKGWVRPGLHKSQSVLILI